MSIPSFDVAAMVKNEQQRFVSLTLGPLSHLINHLYVLDTGSTDSTIQEITDFATASNIPLTLHQSPFVDFSTSRNQLLDMLPTTSHHTFTILLDAADQLQQPDLIAQEITTHPADCYFVKIHVINPDHITEHITEQVRIIANKSIKFFRYIGRVHELLYQISSTHSITSHRLTTSAILQDRAKDKSSTPRLLADVNALIKDIEDPHQPDPERCKKHLHQTLINLNDHNTAEKVALDLINPLYRYPALIQSARCHHNIINIEKSAHLINMAIETNPTDATAYFYKSLFLASVGFIDEAKRTIKKAISLPHNPNVTTYDRTAQVHRINVLNELNSLTPSLKPVVYMTEHDARILSTYLHITPADLRQHYEDTYVIRLYPTYIRQHDHIILIGQLSALYNDELIKINKSVTCRDLSFFIKFQHQQPTITPITPITDDLSDTIDTLITI